MGPYLAQVAAPFSTRVAQGRYYGVDTALFRPASAGERVELRRRLELPRDRFLVLLSSRISHEKDPETVLRAAAMVRARGVDAAVLNLGGGHREFLALAHGLGLESPAEWVLARPAVHPMEGLADYYRAADVLAQGSLEEGLGLSPLEALACETPVVATAIGGMAAHLGPYAALTPRRDAGGDGRRPVQGGRRSGAGPRRCGAGPGVRAAPLDAATPRSASCAPCWPTWWRSGSPRGPERSTRDAPARGHRLGFAGRAVAQHGPGGGRADQFARNRARPRRGPIPPLPADGAARSPACPGSDSARC